MAYPHRQPQDGQNEMMNAAIRAAWKAFSTQIYESGWTTEPENLFLRARQEWLKILRENEWDAGVWIMTEDDKKRVFLLLGWTQNELVRAANANRDFSVNPVNVVRRSGVFSSTGRPQPIVQPHPRYGRPPHLQYLHPPPADVRSGISDQTSNGDDEEEEDVSSNNEEEGDDHDYEEDSNDDGEEENGDTLNEEDDDDDDNEEESNVDENEEENDDDDDNEEERNHQYKPIIRIIGGSSVFPTMFIEPFFKKSDSDHLEKKSPKIAEFARKSAARRLWECHQEAERTMYKISRCRFRGIKNKRREEKLIRFVEDCCEMSHDEWRAEVRVKLAKLRRKQQRELRMGGNTTPTPEAATHHRSEVERDGEEPMGSQQRQRDHPDNLHSGEQRNSGTSSRPKIERGRNGRVERNIYERFTPIVQKRIAAAGLPSGATSPSHADGPPIPKVLPLMPADLSPPRLVEGESLHLPPPTLRDRNSSTPSISQPTRASPEMWYDIDEEAIATKEQTETTSWSSVPHDYVETTLHHNRGASVRSSALILAEEGVDRLLLNRIGEEGTSKNERKGDWAAYASSEGSIDGERLRDQHPSRGGLNRFGSFLAQIFKQ